MIIKSKYDLGQNVRFYRYEDVMYGRKAINKKVEKTGYITGLESSIYFKRQEAGVDKKELEVGHTYVIDSMEARFHVDKSMIIGLVES